MIFGATCSPCSAQFVKNTNAKEFIEESPRAVDAIINRFYVDDYMDSFDSEEEALQVTKRVIEINKRGGFILRNVISNSTIVMDKLSQSSSTKLLNLNVENEPNTEKVPGMFWDISNDQFLFKLKSVHTNVAKQGPNKNISKRELLRILMSIFDPLGLLAHYTIRGKIVMQEVWMRKIEDWDVPLPDDLNEQWSDWLAGLQDVENIRIARNYSNLLLKADRVELHIFTDAGERAFAAVAYWRIEYDDIVEVCLITGKTKIVSQKASKILSMPRMELQGALLGSRLAKMIEHEHSIKLNDTIFWSDSQTVLSWLGTEYGSYKQFVAHRIAEILESSRSEQWRYINTNENPADDATKVTRHKPFDVSNRWFQGPSFLREKAEKWPVDFPKSKTTIEDPEVRRVFVLQQVNHRGYDNNRERPLFDLGKFSDWLELRRITAWIKRGLDNWCKKRKNELPNLRPLSLAELAEAEIYHITQSQHYSYPDEISSLTKMRPVGIKSKIRDLLPYLDEKGVMRMESRVESSPAVSWEMKRPIIMDRHNPVTVLILKFYHEKFLHQFQETVVNEVRTKFWIPQLRVVVKNSKKMCQLCRNERAVPEAPQMSKLPVARTEGFVGCFHHCGVALFGSMLIPVKRSLEKRWGVLFTCLVTRAIYIDLVPDLTADSLILTIRNCNSRRGPIKNLYSDCGTNMKGANLELKAALDEIQMTRIHRECVKTQIEWHFNPPASPHMGGCWERMVRSVKSVLNKLLKEKHPKEQSLRSFLCEVEDVVNSRPLTYIALEKDSDDAITPKHFLNPFFRGEVTQLGEFSNDLSSRKQWRMVQELSNHFWRRWMLEYLPMISRTSKWHEKVTPLQVGDIVIICDNTTPRNTWEKAVVVKVGQTVNGQIRSATVKTSHGLLVRPAVKLAKLDIRKEPVNPQVFTRGGVTDDSSLAQKTNNVGCVEVNRHDENLT